MKQPSASINLMLPLRGLSPLFSRFRVTTDCAKVNFANQDRPGGFWWLRSPCHGKSEVAPQICAKPQVFGIFLVKNLTEVL